MESKRGPNGHDIAHETGNPIDFSAYQDGYGGVTCLYCGSGYVCPKHRTTVLGKQAPAGRIEQPFPPNNPKET